MSSSTSSELEIWNVPNVITMSRFGLSILVFILLPLQLVWATWLALAVFIVAVSTDWMDGYWARKYNQVTKFGRILDPFVDKIIICGTFIFLAGEPASGIVPWMAVVVVGRELLVTMLRSFVEQHGGDFSANWTGKWKMVLQCVAACASMVVLGLQPDLATTTWYGAAGVEPMWLALLLIASVWGAILLTIHSGWIYVVDAARLIRGGLAG